MTTNATAQILHDLMTDMQIAYYMALKCGGTVEQAKQKLRNVAKNAIKNRTIPRHLFVYADVFVKYVDPLALIEKTYQQYDKDNGENHESEEVAFLA